MKEIKAFNEKRAEIYWWFSGIFNNELTDKELETYHGNEIRRFLAGLGENKPLKRSVAHLVNALNRLQDREDAQLELAADYYKLFSNTANDGALPYASAYIGESGLHNNNPAEEMEKLMAEFGIPLTDKLSERADHLAIELDFLGNMIIRSNELEQEKHMKEAFLMQKNYIEKQLLSWLPKFSAKCQQLDVFGFYASVASLLVAFSELDSGYLCSE